MLKRLTASLRHLMKPAFALAAATAVLLLTGCFVIRGERRIKPAGKGVTIATREDSDRVRFSRVVDRPDFKLSLGVENGPARWELQCLFNILPFYIYRIKYTHWPLAACLEIKPKSQNLAFDPRQIFYLGTNQVRLAPVAISQNRKFLGTNISGPLPVTNRTRFRLNYTGPDPEIPRDQQVGPDRHFLNQDVPFQLLIEGLTVSGRPVALTPITFKPSTAIRPGFMLPY